MSKSTGSELEAAPLARVVEGSAGGRRLSRFWWLPVFAIILVGGFYAWTWNVQGTRIEITFEQGHGIKPGDRVRHRGIEVGEVQSVEVSEDLRGIRVGVMLDSSARDLARTGSQFWIVRPQLRLGQVSGLETVVGAKYIAVQPGPAESARASVFTGVETPLAVVDELTTEVEVVFRQGHGLAVGDPLRYRGIQVGEVTQIALTDGLEEVLVRVRLFESPSPFANPGTQYWIERPQVSVTQVRGLETLVGGQYLSALPGSVTGEPPSRFVGLEQPPVGALPAGGLEIVLESPRRHGLRAGVPIDYRGVVIGRVVSVTLAGDATQVEARAWIEPQYRQLVCERSRFWNQSGFDLSIGLTGIRLDADALASIALGSVGMATPQDDAGLAVHTGHRFEFSEEAQDQWLAWQPRIAVGTHLLPEGVTLPVLHRAAVLWQVRRLGFRTDRSQSAWVLWLEDDRIIGPRSLFQTTGTALDGVRIEVAGESLSLEGLDSQSVGTLTRLSGIAVGTDVDVMRMPLARLRSPEGPEDVLLIEPSREPLPIRADKLSQEQDEWRLESGLSLSPDQNGALLVAVRDGAVVGMVSVTDDEPTLALIPATWVGDR